MQVVLRIFFEVFQDEAGYWDQAGMHSALNGKYQHVKFSKREPGQTFLGCLLSCFSPVQP
jgi:hypothetical protein